MTVEEYKRHTVDLTFPSGLVVTIQPPKVKAMMDVASTTSDPAEVLAKLMKLVEAQFPEGFTLDDISEPKDWAYLQEWIGRFFQETVPASAPTLNGSSGSDSSKADSGPTTS